MTEAEFDAAFGSDPYAPAYHDIADIDGDPACMSEDDFNAFPFCAGKHTDTYVLLSRDNHLYGGIRHGNLLMATSWIPFAAGNGIAFVLSAHQTSGTMWISE